MSTRIYHFKINNLGITDKAFNSLPFGRQIEYFKKFEEFKNRAKNNHMGCKRMTYAKGIREWKKLYQPTEYFFIENGRSDQKDDCIEVWYIIKQITFSPA